MSLILIGAEQCNIRPLVSFESIPVTRQWDVQGKSLAEIENIYYRPCLYREVFSGFPENLFPSLPSSIFQLPDNNFQ